MTPDPSWPVLAGVAALLGLWALTVHRHRAWRRASTWRRLLVLGLLAVVGMQFQHPEADIEPATAVDIVLVIDRTTSMGAQDWAGRQPRMAGVVHDVAALTRSQPTARYSVVVVDNVARVSLPWSTDTAALRTLTETMGWREATQGVGSDVTAGVDLAVELLEASAAARPDATRYLVYFGDGEQTGQQEPRSFAPAAGLVTDALVLGYGTAAGGPMAVAPGSPHLVLAGDQPAISELDESRLREMADQLDGSYVARPGTPGLTFWPAAQEPPAPVTPGGFTPSLSWLAAFALLPLTAWELWHSVGVLLMARREVLR